MKNFLSFKEKTQKRRNIGGLEEVDHSKHNDPPIYQRDGSWNNARVERDIMNPDRKECLFVTVGDRSDRFFLPPLSIRTLGRLQLVFIPCLEIAARAFSSGAICIERRHSIKDNEETQREKGRKIEREKYRVHFVKTRFIANRESPRFSPPPPPPPVFNRRFNETEQNRRRPLMHIHHDRLKPCKPNKRAHLQVNYKLFMTQGLSLIPFEKRWKARFFNPISIMNRQYLRLL